jgi:hypothetical protein
MDKKLDEILDTLIRADTLEKQAAKLREEARNALLSIVNEPAEFEKNGYRITVSFPRPSHPVRFDQNRAEEAFSIVEDTIPEYTWKIFVPAFRNLDRIPPDILQKEEVFRVLEPFIVTVNDRLPARVAVVPAARKERS